MIGGWILDCLHWKSRIGDDPRSGQGNLHQEKSGLSSNYVLLGQLPTNYYPLGQSILLTLGNA